MPKDTKVLKSAIGSISKRTATAAKKNLASGKTSRKAGMASGKSKRAVYNQFGRTKTERRELASEIRRRSMRELKKTHGHLSTKQHRRISSARSNRAYTSSERSQIAQKNLARRARAKALMGRRITSSA